MRIAETKRKTSKTNINLSLDLDGSGKTKIDTGCEFLDHMLDSFAWHGKFDLIISCKGNSKVDLHHTVEDVGMVMGEAFDRAIGDRTGINRYGWVCLPMDEALTICAIDISERAYFASDVIFAGERVGDMEVELVSEFFKAFARNLKATLHFKQLSGGNTHHVIESMFKGFGHALSMACAIDGSSVAENSVVSGK